MIITNLINVSKLETISYCRRPKLFGVEMIFNCFFVQIVCKETVVNREEKAGPFPEAVPQQIQLYATRCHLE